MAWLQKWRRQSWKKGSRVGKWGVAAYVVSCDVDDPLCVHSLEVSWRLRRIGRFAGAVLHVE